MTQATIPNAPQLPGVPGAPTQSVTQGNTNTGNTNTGNTIVTVGRVNMPTTQLFEVTGFIDTNKKFPTSNAFVTFIPGQPDSTKLSGRTYVQDKRETMKISNRDLFGLAEAIKFAATYNQCDFMIFTDSSKFAGNNGRGINKRISISAAPSKRDPNKYLVFINYKGSGNITLALEKWMSIGLAEQLKALATETEKKKFEIENTNR